MNYTIAVAGKGGTGKTTIAGLIVRYLRENRLSSVLAVDADPNSNLGQVLGVDPRENIGAIIDEISKNIDRIPAGMTKERYIEYRVQSAIEESGGLDLVSMGRPEGPGCYCYANNVLRGIMAKISRGYNFVIIDNEAGLEHLSRRTMRKAECLFIISDPTPVGLNSAKRIYDITKELEIEIKKFVLLINRTRNGQKIDLYPIRNIISDNGVKFVPDDQTISESASAGKPLMSLSKSSPALQAVFEIMEGIWH